jgi:hypothetical protein
MRNIIILAAIVSLISCKSPSSNEEKTTASLHKDNVQNEYPKLIDSMGIKDLYDSARWLTYCINCDDTCAFNEESHIKDTIVTFGELDLLDRGTKLYSKDTIDITFKILMDTIEASFREKRPSSASNGVQYKISDKTLLSVIEYHDLPYHGVYGIPRRENERMFAPLQPEVIKYINVNKNKLNPWFYNEAKRRGVIKE